ncbi:MAG: cob(I)yrinic acid a,c-diamide adenosyltransferase [Patescibacteria group bacterium]
MSKKIYTKTGDLGKTSLFNGTRVSKNNDRINLLGILDELNSLIGFLIFKISANSLLKDFNVCMNNKNNKTDEEKFLQKIQNFIFEINSEIATFGDLNLFSSTQNKKKMDQENKEQNNKKIKLQKKFLSNLSSFTKEIEQEIDRMTEKLPTLTNFILPGGSEISAICHIVRTNVRKTEREFVNFLEKLSFDMFGTKEDKLKMIEKINEQNFFYKTTLPFLNRLSDYFFTLARWKNFEQNINDIIWKREN